ncbi:hypothetical protein GDO86_013787 [Hymenochirus boettgeri]|uniref:Transmembrane protein 238 n=1 Tax=Hymenochirus boettgeri TaxID=247094 RepID=A0A8T2JLA7_9PIPI|nr:hypothetical protein GDO86_013787 [Hymenochirus boettgeri]
MAFPRIIGRCPIFFLMAVSLDVSGLSLLLIGIFVNLEVNGQSFGEFLIYSGGILVFFSLLLWLAWYSLNLEVSMEELLREGPEPPRRSNFAQLARKVSESLSRRSKRRILSGSDSLGQPTPSLTGDPHITLAPPIFINRGFMNQLDVPTPIQEEKALELSSIISHYSYTVTLPTQVKATDRLV